MTKRDSARRRRRKLTAHDHGLNRHHKGLSWIEKTTRQAAERVTNKDLQRGDVVRAVPCPRPECSAPAGEWCRDGEYVRVGNVHRARRAAARPA